MTAYLCAAVIGLQLFFTTPRYVDDDYRGLIAQSVQRGRAEDTFFAIFSMAGRFIGVPMSPRTLAHGFKVQTRFWQVRVRSNGGMKSLRNWTRAWKKARSGLRHRSRLEAHCPPRSRAYLATQATNLEWRWYGSATRLSAWRRQEPAVPAATDISFGPLQLTAAGIAPKVVAGDNSALDIALAWGPAAPGILDDLFVHRAACRFQAKCNGHTGLRAPRNACSHIRTRHADRPCPALQSRLGLAPDRYTLSVGVGISGTEQMLPPKSSVDEVSTLVKVLHTCGRSAP